VVDRGSKAEGVVELARAMGMKLDVRPWDFLSAIAKDAARGWFVKRAEERGIRWTESVKELQEVQPELDQLYTEICDPELEYPSYYTQAFHGYDEGNLEWKAAHELKPATESMGLGYYEGLTWEESQDMYRGAARAAIAEHWAKAHQTSAGASSPSRLLDVGCSGGYSTDQMSQVFPGVDATGLDLSPHFLAVASKTYPGLKFKHGRAEATGFQDGEFDAVTFNYILHELPKQASIEALEEAWRVCAPGGMVAVLDVEPKRLLELPPFRRWAFQVTEPWCCEGEYYSLDVAAELQRIGFELVEDIKNDPVNHLVMAVKPASAA